MGDNPATLANSSEGDTPSGGSLEEISGKIMVAAIIVLFLVIVFVFFLHLYARWFWSRRNNGEATHSTRRRSRRFVFAPGQGPAVALHRGLEPSVVRALPVLIFHPKDFKEGGLECAVCLSELVDGEKARLLPKCNHGFHLECIDMWFHSHSTCPLCRNTVGLDSDKESSSTSPESQLSVIEENSSSESPNFPTNVLFWGNQTLVSTRTIGLEEAEQHPSRTSLSMSPLSPTSTSPNTSQDGSLVIEIPGMLEGFSSLSPSSSRFADDEMKSPMLSPMVTRLRSFRRLLSREKRVLPCSPGSVDVEQGESGRGQSSKTSSESWC